MSRNQGTNLYPVSDLGTGRKLILMGDSMTRQETGGASSTRNAYQSARSPWTWAQVRLGFPFYCPSGYDASDANKTIGYNLGVGGDTAVLMNARFNQALALKPDIIAIQGGTNDITGGDTYANIIAAHQAMINKSIAFGALPVVFTIPPRTDAVGASYWASATQKQLHQAVNNKLRDLANQQTKMVLVDATSRLVDNTNSEGKIITAYSQDGLHLTQQGGYWMGDALYEALVGRVVDPRIMFMNVYDTYDATYNLMGNLMTNGTLSGTAGTNGTGCTGNVATSFQMDRSVGATVTVVSSKSTKLIGENAIITQIFDITSTGLGVALETIRMRTSPTSITANIATDDWIYGECNISSGAPSANGLIRELYMDVQDVTASGNRSRCLAADTANGALPNVAWAGKLRTKPLKLLGNTGVRYSLQMSIDGTIAGTWRVIVDSVAIRKPFTVPPIVYTT